jgi:polyhydroxybutyrate depolymerase
MSPRQTFSLRRTLGWLPVAAGTSAIAIPVLEWSAHLVAGPDRLDERVGGFALHGEASLHNLPFSSLRFFAPGLLLIVVGFGLRRAAGGGRPSAAALTVTAAAAAATLAAGWLSYGPGLDPTNPLQAGVMAGFVWGLPVAAIVTGIATGKPWRRGVSLFSFLLGALMLLVAAVSVTYEATEQTNLAVTTVWLTGLGAWLLITGVRRDAPKRPRAGWRLPVVAPLAVIGGLAVVVLGAALGELFGPLAWSGLTGRTQVATLDQGPVRRTYRVYRPASPQARPGLVLVLHGSDGTGLEVERGSGFDRQADRLGWLVAYPDGFADGWDANDCCPHPGVDDIGFISALIARLEAASSVDPDRVYVAGVSRGGMMAYQLACSLSSRLAAIAPVAGNMATPDGSAREVQCAPDRPVSVLDIHGSADAVIPIEGGSSRVSEEPSSFAPLSDVITRWRDLDGCKGPGSIAVSGPSTTTTWACLDRSEVASRVVSGGQHAWPRSEVDGLPSASGPDASFSASRVIADFFVAHTRAPAPSVR